ncbi:MAG TPA: MotA/TolQ/ExbB proton channel family protein [Planctomycetota bacterium]|jgi:biopolymer transport protein ExbB|nr:MotA/TolQ/ExbB proton channel family protein [Planctomycetota bacterium]
MKALTSTLCVLRLAVGGFAQPPAAGDTMGQLSRSAEQDLAKSIEELTRLREEIATEKLPLAQELSTLEERVSQLRREHDQVTRSLDAGNLEIPTLKAEMKARQDELAYVGNLLDEYARTFESKVNVSELQHCGPAIETAKQATENAALSIPEKLARQIAFVTVSLARLFDVIGGMRFPGVAVDSDGSVADGQFAIVGPVALFRAKNGAAGLVVPQSGSTKPLFRPLEGAMQAGLAALVETGEGTLPLDPSRGGALKALIQKTNLIHIFRKGGPIMWPLLLASILALGTVLERILFLVNERRKRDPRALERLFEAVERGDTEGAIRASKASRDYVVRTLVYALGHVEKSLSSALLYAQAQELKRFRRGIPILDTVITLAPLLGLLGTVTGMMGSFSLIGGELSAPGAITGGIAEALIATAFGLGIAITALLPFNFLNARMEDARHEIESAATQMELLAHPQASNGRALAPALDPLRQPVGAGSE